MFSPLLASALALAPAYHHLGATPPPHGLPVIKTYVISSTDMRPGQTIRGTVDTSPNVDYVEARVQYRNQPMQRTGPGKFVLAYKLPWWLPPWARHAYTLEIVARTADGVENWLGIPIVIR